MCVFETVSKRKTVHPRHEGPITFVMTIILVVLQNNNWYKIRKSQ